MSALAPHGRIECVPWRPPYEIEAQARDARLDPYRERAAILTSPGGLVATLFVRMETYWTQTSGHLWWRQWSGPYEVPHGYMMLADGGFDDWVVGQELLHEDLTDWSQNKLRYDGEVLDIEWLDDRASRHVRDHVLGLGAE
jgi:hypothetical protein